MSAAIDLLTNLQNMGVLLSLNGDKIRVKAPAGVVTEDLRRTLAERKLEIIDLLSKCACPPNENIIDLRVYLAKLCRRLPMPPEHLLRHYFTPDDLADIRAGRYADPYALAAFIKTDPRYPFECK